MSVRNVLVRDAVEERVAGLERVYSRPAIGVADREVAHRAVDVVVLSRRDSRSSGSRCCSRDRRSSLEDKAVDVAVAGLVAADQPEFAIRDCRDRRRSWSWRPG